MARRIGARYFYLILDLKWKVAFGLMLFFSIPPMQPLMQGLSEGLLDAGALLDLLTADLLQLRDRAEAFHQQTLTA